VRYELGVYIPEDDILHSHRRGNLLHSINWLSPVSGDVISQHVVPVPFVTYGISLHFSLLSFSPNPLFTAPPYPLSVPISCSLLLLNLLQSQSPAAYSSLPSFSPNPLFTAPPKLLQSQSPVHCSSLPSFSPNPLFTAPPKPPSLPIPCSLLLTDFHCSS
jgi:hypothetical protein